MITTRGLKVEYYLVTSLQKRAKALKIKLSTIMNNFIPGIEQVKFNAFAAALISSGRAAHVQPRIPLSTLSTFPQPLYPTDGQELGDILRANLAKRQILHKFAFGGGDSFHPGLHQTKS